MTVVLAALLALRAGTQPTDRVATGVALLFAPTLLLGSHLARAVKLRTLLIHPAFAQLPELARQRRRLTHTRTRHALAVSSRQTVADLDRRPSRFELDPIFRDRVTASRSQLLDIADELDTVADPDPISVALIRELLGDVYSPLYNPNCPATDLHHALRRARAALTPPPDAANLADRATQRELMNLQTTANVPAKQSATNATERTRVPQINGQNAFKRTDCRDRHEHVNDDPQRRLVDLDQLDAGPGNVSDAEPPGCRRRGLHRRSFLLSALIVIGCAGAAQASAATLRVCAHGCAYTEIGDAVTAAAPSDHLAVGAGTFEGGFTIARDLTLTGAGAGRTTIRGGGPVITLGVAGATSEPTVSIRDVTITGGIARSSFNGTDEALGGGVLVPPSANSGPGATVVISRSVISGNLVAPAASVDAGFSCGAADCQFAHAGGGGVDSWGDVTVRDSVVSDNQAAGRLTSDADGAGIYAQAGSLTVEHTIVTANRAVAAAPDGRYAEGAGIMFDAFFSPGCGPPQLACRLVVRDSTVSANASTLTNPLPAFAGGQLIAMLANAGGIHVGDSIPTTVQNTTIASNTTTASDPRGSQRRSMPA